jgi:hypothetical protein
LKLKIDENLPADCAVLLRNAGFEADTVADERLAGADDTVIASRSRADDRVLVTLDLDFSNVRAYPPAQQDKRTVLALMERIVLALTTEHRRENSGSWSRIEFGSAPDSEAARDAGSTQRSLAGVMLQPTGRQSPTGTSA